MGYGGDDKYYNPNNKLVNDGDTVYADDLNNVNRAADASFTQIAEDLDALDLKVSTDAVTSKAWATSEVGVNPDPTLTGDYSSKANATESKNWASSDVTVIDASGTDTGEKSAKTNAAEANTAKVGAETAQTNAETAQTAAELAQTNAETAQTAAELAKTNAETAQTNAETAQTAAELAQTNAEAAKTGAEEAEANAQAYAASTGNPNLLINSSFIINQEGYVNGSTISVKYGHDMWFECGGAGLSYSVNADGSITLLGLTGGVGVMLAQANDDLFRIADGKTITISIESGSLLVGDFSMLPTEITPGNPFTFTFNKVVDTATSPFGGGPFPSDPTINAIVISAGEIDRTFSGLKVELGTVATPCAPEEYIVTYNKCIQYLQEIASTKGLLANSVNTRVARITNAQFLYVDPSSNAEASIIFNLKAPMRSIPTFYYKNYDGGISDIYLNSLYDWSTSSYKTADYFQLSNFIMHNSSIYIGYCTWSYVNGLHFGPPVNLRTQADSIGATLFFDARYH